MEFLNLNILILQCLKKKMELLFFYNFLRILMDGKFQLYL